MSRYNLGSIRPEHRGYEIVVGWDSTLGNFFGEVRRPRDNPFDLGGEVMVSVARLRASASYHNLNREFQEVVKAISDYAIIDANLRTALWADSNREGFGLRSSKGR
jgi:hypothetical protein